MNRPFPQRAVHLDFHTMPRVYDVGAEFDADQFARTLEEARVEYITVFARCNLGFAYYPTRVGLVHPGMQTEDMLGPMIEACHARDIQPDRRLPAGPPPGVRARVERKDPGGGGTDLRARGQGVPEDRWGNAPQGLPGALQGKSRFFRSGKLREGVHSRSVRLSTGGIRDVVLD